MTRFTGMTDALSGARRREAGEFADLLESGRTLPGSDLAALVGLARALTPAEHLPEPTFRTALRAQLVAEAAARVPALPAQRSPERARPATPRWRHAVAAVAVASAVTGVGAAAASSQALPGDTLYGLKLRVEAIQLSLADSDLERGRELLEQAEARLGEAERLADDNPASTMSPSTRKDLTATLTTMDAAATAGAAALVESYEETGDPESMLVLARFVDRQQVRLQDLSVGLDPELRARVLRSVDTLTAMGTAADAVLSPIASRAGEAAGPPGPVRVDGRAASPLAGRGALPPSAATGTGSVDGVDGVVGAPQATSGATATGTSVPSVTSLPAATATAAPLPGPTAPVPSVAVPPAPTLSSPAQAPTTPVLPSATAPLVTCVAVPPLTAC